MEFPAVGHRYADSSGTLYDAGATGRYWTSVAYGSNDAYTLGFNSSVVGPQGTWHRRYGLSVRCVR
ncbi:MAG: fibrobacter succinogenes major paralogous domain-containing protein [Rikenellaceae bacterium]|nr:fibrobacter succinogenes major paralogous domain-containing protein [Rikenellaceae bacterium]